MIERASRLIPAIALETLERTRSLRRSERGQAFVEYTLLLLLVAVAIAGIADWGGLKSAISGALTAISNAIKNA